MSATAKKKAPAKRASKRAGRTQDVPPAPDPWHRQPKESAQAFAAFRAYLEAGPQRTTRGIAAQLAKSHTLIGRWSSQWRWQQRVAAFEHQAVEQSDVAHMSEIAKRSARQAQIAQLHGEATATVSAAFMRRLQTNPDLLERMEIGQLAHLAATMIRAHARAVPTERLALGISTENRGSVGDVSPLEERVLHMSDHELEALLAEGGIGAGVVDLGAERQKRRAS